MAPHLTKKVLSEMKRQLMRNKCQKSHNEKYVIYQVYLEVKISNVLVAKRYGNPGMKSILDISWDI